MTASILETGSKVVWEDRPNQKVTAQLFSENLAKIFAQNINHCYGKHTAKAVQSRQAQGWRVLIPARKYESSMEMLQIPNIRTIQTIQELAALSGTLRFSVPKITYIETYKQKEPYENMKETLLQLDELKNFKVAFDDAEQKIAYCEGRSTLEHLFPFSHRYFDPLYEISNDSIVDCTIFEQNLQMLLDDARTFFQSAPLHPTQPQPYSTGNDTQLIAQLLKDHQGFCIGEIHSENSGRQFLIKNMQTLREQGVTTLFMEFLHYDTMQDLLDAYFNSSDAYITGYLATHLEEFDSVSEQRYRCDRAYGYAKIIECAKKAGIRVVGIDTALSTECGRTSWGATEPERLLAMNFVAQQIIQQEMGEGKFVAFMGRDHVKREEGSIPTVPEILNLSSIYIERPVQ